MSRDNVYGFWAGNLKLDNSNSGKSLVVSDGKNNSIRVIRTQQGLLIDNLQGIVKGSKAVIDSMEFLRAKPVTEQKKAGLRIDIKLLEKQANQIGIMHQEMKNGLSENDDDMLEGLLNFVTSALFQLKENGAVTLIVAD